MENHENRFVAALLVAAIVSISFNLSVTLVFWLKWIPVMEACLK